MPSIADVIGRITPLDRAVMQAVHERLDQLTKPAGSLGRLEELAVQLAGITGQACRASRLAFSGGRRCSAGRR